MQRPMEVCAEKMHTRENGHPGTIREVVLGKAPADHKSRTQTKPGLCSLARPPPTLPVHRRRDRGPHWRASLGTDKVGAWGKQRHKEQEGA